VFVLSGGLWVWHQGQQRRNPERGTDGEHGACDRQAPESERDLRSKIIHVEAEFQASQTLVNAAKILSSIPAAMQLRYLRTLTEIGAEQNSTAVFPMPIDIIKPSLDRSKNRPRRGI
jgi:hypothetical protein